MRRNRKFSAIWVLLFWLFVFGQPAWGKDEEAIKTGESTETMETMVVTATKTPYTLNDAPVETILITSEDIEHSNAQTIASLLNEIPGFNFSQQPDLTGTMGYKSTIRGLNVEDRRTLVLVDGQRVFGGYHTGGMAGGGDAFNLNMVPASMVDHIEVVKGPASALYGSEAVSGVINIITKQPSKEFEATVGGGYSWYTVDGSYYGVPATEKERTSYNAYTTLAWPISDRLSATISYNRQENDGIKETEYTITKNYLQTQVQLDATEQLTLRGGAEITDYEADGNTTLLGGNDEDTMDEKAPRIWFTGNYLFTPNHRIKLQTYFQNLDGEIYDPVNGGAQDYDNTYKDVELQYTGRYFETHQITLGTEYLNTSYKGNWVEDGVTETFSIYTQDEWNLFNDALVLIPGLRFDDNSDYGEEWSPKFNFMYSPLADTKIRGGLGWTFKAPTLRELTGKRFWMGYAWAEGNADLKPESGFTWQLGVEQVLPAQRITLSLTYYNTSLDDMIDTETSVLSTGEYLIRYLNRDSVEIQGIEVSADIEITELISLLFTYTWTDARDASTDERLDNVPENAIGARLNYTDKARGFGAMVSLSYSSEQNNTYAPPLYTQEFTTVGAEIWKSIMKNGRISLEATNILDEELRDAALIYPRQMITANLQFTF